MHTSVPGSDHLKLPSQQQILRRPFIFYDPVSQQGPEMLKTLDESETLSL